MNWLTIAIAALTVLMLGFTALCGFWIHTHGQEPGSMTWHMGLAGTTALCALVTVVVALF